MSLQDVDKVITTPYKSLKQTYTDVSTQDSWASPCRNMFYRSIDNKFYCVAYELK